jgi:hypothetical protein
MLLWEESLSKKSQQFQHNISKLADQKFSRKKKSETPDLARATEKEYTGNCNDKSGIYQIRIENYDWSLK